MHNHLVKNFPHVIAIYDQEQDGNCQIVCMVPADNDHDAMAIALVHAIKRTMREADMAPYAQRFPTTSSIPTNINVDQEITAPIAPEEESGEDIIIEQEKAQQSVDKRQE